MLGEEYILNLIKIKEYKILLIDETKQKTKIQGWEQEQDNNTFTCKKLMNIVKFLRMLGRIH